MRLTPSEPSPRQEYSVDEEIHEESPLEGDAEGLEDLESYPSGSVAAAGAEQSGDDFDLRVDQITDELLA